MPILAAIRERASWPQDQSEPQNSDAHSEKNFPEDSGTAAVGWIQIYTGWWFQT